MTSPPALAFDLDGVLVDSRLAFTTCVNAALGDHGLPPRDEETLLPYLGPPLHATMQELAGPDDADSLVERYRKHYRERSAELTTVVPGIPEALTALSDRALLVVTSKSKPLADSLLDDLGLKQHFAATYGPALSERAESKRTTLARALESWEIAALVGDRRYDIEAAKHHSLGAIGALWGIGDEAELKLAGADVLLSDPAELTQAR